jgi:hypothetical protein
LSDSDPTSKTLLDQTLGLNLGIAGKYGMDPILTPLPPTSGNRQENA